MTSAANFPPSTRVEFDLFTISQVVWRQKGLIGAAAALVGLLFAIYAFFIATPVYQVTSVLRPVALNDMDALNRSALYSLSPEAALLRVGTALDSYEARLNYFRANEALFKPYLRAGMSVEQAFEEFNRSSLKVTMPAPDSGVAGMRVTIDMSYPAGVDGVAILNGFVSFAIAAERNLVQADFDVILKNRLNEVAAQIDAQRAVYDGDKKSQIARLLEQHNLKRSLLEDELNALRQQLKVQRSNRISELSEAISIARSLGIKRPTTPSMLGDSAQSSSGSVVRTEVSNQTIPLYFMGSDALEAERAVLQKRTSDDFSTNRVAEIQKELQLLQANRQVEILKRRQNDELFLLGIEPMEKEMVRLKGLNTDMQELKMVLVDRSALQSPAPIKPMKSLLVVLGALLGALLGAVFVVLARYMTLRRSAMAIH
ncbi:MULTISPECIES: Wzz/FepE/Etk N-terminal domain-containing protein [unclassified Pseudomonas]|uniref:Wzz/FepE/Etk N-terminal domain-containing protein n=1 Tax=unclassified Pseudomonas TaxID=196821 RepID=UPI0021C82979|nr:MULTISPECIES: Wzz/FepE/Etk N-terminal domain-containing protein [unclassified Pseudomonas]MCU1733996.1 Wzz/FepE/Etk N-terminal domain-containing protein [Pseudomonas sp. 20P_3.2_Bac4]MCU1742336.1 Wzz/FepE/Etk N-terminal domain-containing protein [Pseudomonas sp. 20P_3.2_Bac5]